jgi:hypothetical protein
MSWLRPRASRQVTVELRWPRTVDEDAVAGFFASLAAEASPGPVVLEMVGQAGTTAHRLTLPQPRRAVTIRRLQLAVPGLIAAPPAAPTPRLDRALGLRLSSKRRSLRTDNPAELATNLLSTLAGARNGEVVLLQWLLGPRLRALAVPNRFEDFSQDSWWARVLRAPLRGPGPVDIEFRNAIRAKQSAAGWRATARLAVSAATPDRERQLLHELLAALRVAESPGLKLQAVASPPRHVVHRKVPWRWPLVVNEREIVGLVGWPLGDVHYPGVSRSQAASLRADRRVARRGRVLADWIEPGHERPLGLTVADSQHHAWVVGPTGVGKSTLLLNLLVQDLEAGRGAALVDSKGDLVRDVLARAPDKRLDDIVVLDPGDTVAPVGLNPLRGNIEAAPLLADQLLGVLHRLHGENLGPRSTDMLHACFLTLARHRDMTLCALPLLLSNARFRLRLTRGLDDPLGLGSFWGWYESISETERQHATAPVMNKLRQFLLRPAMRRVLGQARPRFGLHQVFTERKIVLVSLAKGQLGPEAAQLFGTLVLHQLWQTTLGRVAVPPQRRHPVMVYLDEFQDYLRLPTDLSDVLVQARGLGVGLTMAHQHLGQLTPDVRSALLANAGSRVCFRLNHDDATIMGRGGRLPDVADFAGLGRYEAYLSLLAKGERTAWASGRTRPPSKPERPSEQVRDRSRARYGVPAGEVERELRQLTHPSKPPGEPEQIGRRPRGSRS